MEETSSVINDATTATSTTTSTTNYNNTDDNLNNKDNHEDNHKDIVSSRSSKNKSDIEKAHLVHEFKDDTLEHNQHMNFMAYASFKVILSSSSYQPSTTLQSLSSSSS